MFDPFKDSTQFERRIVWSCFARELLGKDHELDSLFKVCMLPIGTQEQNIMGINEVEAG